MIKKLLSFLCIFGATFLLTLGSLWAISQARLAATPVISIEEIQNLVKEEKFDEAIRFSKRRIRAFPDEKITYYLLGTSYEEKRQFKEAEKIYEKLIETSDIEPTPHFYLGRVYYEENYLEAAIDELKRSEELSEKYLTGDTKKESLIQTWALLSYIYMELMKDYKKAAVLLEKLVEMDPKNWEAHYELGTAYAYSGRPQNAYKEFSKIVEENPGTDIAKYAENAIQYVREGRNPGKSSSVLL